MASNTPAASRGPGHGGGPGAPNGPGRAASRGSRRAPRSGRGSRDDGTFLPEGGSTPTGPGGLREWPAVLVLALLAGSLVTAALFGFRSATLMVGGTLTVAAILRLFVREVGILAVRSRFTDVMVMLVLGGAVVMLGLSVPPPLVDLPWVPRRTG
ncbi:DUF3017 domain-containing protein [Streptodolium elevatio]|uniref:DUF3017 domain-containing protein n=1 Tax=Streptodolium elevatio TaxID=3157996 RepID=A0ABV3DLE3_9ACTN